MPRIVNPNPLTNNPPSNQGRRRPNRLRVRSDRAPQIGVMTSATKPPMARMMPSQRPFSASPAISLTRSAMVMTTGVSSAIQMPNWAST